MERPESAPQLEQAQHLSLKESIRLSMSRKRVEAARQLDSRVNQSPGQSRAAQTSKPIHVIKPTSFDARKYNARLDDAFLGIGHAASAPRQQTEDEMAEAQADADMRREGHPSGWRTAGDGIQEITITSYAHFVETITDTKDLYNAITQRYNTKIVLKGLPSRSTGLKSTILDDNADRDSGAIRAMEAAWIRGFLADPPPDMSVAAEPTFSTNVWACLSLMHRHNFPTRLMEWTFNPNVALYFASESLDSNDDGEIWFVAPAELYSSQTHALSQELARRHLYCPTVSQLQGVSSSLISDSPNADIVAALGRHDALSAKNGPCMTFLEPSHFDCRMVNQACVYAVASDPSLELAEILQRFPSCARRIIIPNFLKGVLQQSLNLVNIHSGWLFPGDNKYNTKQAHRRTGFTPSPEDVKLLLQQRLDCERQKRKEVILSRWAAERAAREIKHKEKSWPPDNKVTKSSRGVLCKKSFAAPELSRRQSLDESYMVDLGSLLSGTAGSDDVVEHEQIKSSVRSRRQSMETATVISVSFTDNDYLLDDRSVQAQEDHIPAVDQPIDRVSEEHKDVCLQLFFTDAYGKSNQDQINQSLAETPSKANPPPLLGIDEKYKAPYLGRAMRETMHFVSSPIREMHSFVKNLGSAQKYSDSQLTSTQMACPINNASSEVLSHDNDTALNTAEIAGIAQIEDFETSTKHSSRILESTGSFDLIIVSSTDEFLASRDFQ